MKPRIMASSPEINMTTKRRMSSKVIGIGAHALRKVMRGSPPRWRGESAKAIAAPGQGGNVGVKCLILRPFLL
jgi:hypothetical protein